MDSIPNYMIKGTNLIFGDSQAPFERAIYRGSLVAVTSNAVGGALTLQNTTGYDLYVKEMIVDVTTKATNAATVDIGVDDVADTSNDGIIDGLDVATAAILATSLISGGTKGTMVRWKKGEYIVATASGTLVGLVGTYRIEAVPA